MKKTPKHAFIFTVTMALALLFGIGEVLADSSNDLEKAIEEKREEVKKLNQEIDQTQSTITNLQGQGRTLSQAIGQLDTGIKQAALSIRSSEVNIDRLGLEIESLNYEVLEVGDEVRSKRGVVGELLRRLQRSDRRTLLETLLTSGSISDGVAEINAIKALQDTLSSEALAFIDLQHRLNDTILVSGDRRDQLEIETINLENRKLILGEQKGQKEEFLVRTKNQEGEYQKELTLLENQQRALLSEISDIETQLSKGFDRSTVPSRQAGMLIWPVTSGGVRTGVLTQHYGETAYSAQFYRGRPHNGTDIGAPTGTEVRAGASGKVVHVDYNGLYYQYGRYILVDHGNGLTTLYAHLSRSIVSAGERVEQGDLIGYIGNTGFSTGPHLHLGLYATPSGGWSRGGTRELGGLVFIPPASGLVPIGVTLNPEQYL